MNFREKKISLPVVILLIICGIIMISTATESHADIIYTTTFYDTDYQTITYDGSGWVDINAHNSTGSLWNGFNVFLNNAPLSAYIVDSGIDAPQSSQNPLAWASSSNHFINLYFDDDPVDLDNTANFRVHIENPFGYLLSVGFYPKCPVPTAVPEASTMLLLSCILFGLLVFGKGRTLRISHV